MVVWQGITEGGTAVPVQITEEGKVVAIGQVGPEGPEGPEGPPGVAEWPPNPIEGAFLVWLNGEPTWYTEQPIPIPPGTSSPIIQVDQNLLLTFESDIDQNIFFQGVQVYAVNADGSDFAGGTYNTSQTWSATNNGQWINVQNAFDGNLDTQAEPANTVNARGTVTFSAIVASKIEFYAPAQGGNADGSKVFALQSDGTEHAYTYDSTGTSVAGWLTIYDGAQKQFTEFGTQRTPDNKSGGGVRAYRVDGKTLVDSGKGLVPTGQISTAVNNSILLSRVQGVWSEGLRIKSDASAQAAWLISKRRNGKILGDKE